MSKFIFLYLLIFTLFFGCRKKESGIEETCISETIVARLEMVEGEVHLVANSWVIDVNSSGANGRYFACNFPEQLKIENHIIVFDANVFEIPPNLKLLGTPIIITHVY